MLDINLIREKPEWVKEQIAKLNDAPALARIDIILDLDKERRALLTESEAIQAARNKLNKGVGKLRGDKQTPDGMKAAMARHIALAINEGEYDEAIHVIEGGGSVNAPRKDDTVADAMDEMMAALKSMGERVETINDQLRGIDASLEEYTNLLPNIQYKPL